jgi:hypothetical protein
MERIVSFTCRVQNGDAGERGIQSWADYIADDLKARDFDGLSVVWCESSIVPLAQPNSAPLPTIEPKDRCPRCDSMEISYGGGRSAVCQNCGQFSEDQADFDVDADTDPECQVALGAFYAERRAGSAHEEQLVSGRSICAVCGDVIELSTDSVQARTWHGDTFDPVLWPPLAVTS